MGAMRRNGAGRGPRILVENSEYWLSNVGDLAMLEVTVRRLRERWPGARVGVLTNTPLLLRAYVPGAEPVAPRGRRPWPGTGWLGRLCARLGPRVVGPPSIGWVTAKAWVPQKARGALRRTRRRWGFPVPVPAPDAPTTAHAVVAPNTVACARQADLVLALGGGYVTDADAEQATRVLRLLGLAHRLGLPTAMVGQGLGPVEDPGLLAQLRQTLPGVSFLGLREPRRGPELLARVGVPPASYTVTGDDAIELSHRLRRPALGTDLGVCLRVAGYAPVPDDVRRRLGPALQTVAGHLGAGLAPVIIAEYRSQDRRSTLPLVRGYHPVRRPPRRFPRPEEVAAQVAHCRVVVTGAYHAGVFALAQGIPVVGLTTSTYYDDKFLGLEAMFPGGVDLVRLDDVGAADRVIAAALDAWRRAPELRDALLTRAEEQIVASRQGFDRVCGLLARPASATPAEQAG